MGVINATNVLRYIERKLGVSHMEVLELSKKDFMETVIQETLPTFSNYYPCFPKITIDPTADAVPGHIGVFYLKTDYELLGVSKVLYNEIQLGIFPSYWRGTNPLDNYMINSIESLAVLPLTFEFRSPNMVEVYPKNKVWSSLLVELKAVHPAHMTTIPNSLRELFMKLAYYDVAASLHPIRQRFANVNTIYGSIELFMDKLQEAEDKREELLEKLRSNFAKDPRRKKLYMF